MRRILVAVLVVGLLPVTVMTTSASAAERGEPKHPPTTWVCRPGMTDDACAMRLTTTAFTPTGRRIATANLHPSKLRRGFDCFYVYPTVSDQPTPNATLAVDPEIRSIARYQAARYGQHCKVYAPVYRQATLNAILQQGAGSADAFQIAYGDVQAAFDEYLARYNHGHGFVLIGHSQGAGMLTQLVQQRIDTHRSVRRRLVSAILLGGNVTVTTGRDVGGSFQHVPACRSRRQTGCVVAFSTFDETPPPDAIFGRAGGPFSGGADTDREVLCTNPAALGGGASTVTSIFPSEPFAPGTTIGTGTAAVGFPPPVKATRAWIAFPRSFRASCSSAGGAHVLRVSPRGGAPDPRAIPNAGWGLHLLDANIALGDLVALVHDQELAYLRRS